jgi:hypothetical protein
MVVVVVMVAVRVVVVMVVVVVLRNSDRWVVGLVVSPVSVLVYGGVWWYAVSIWW